MDQPPFRWWLIHVWPAFGLFDQLVRLGSSIYTKCTTARPNPINPLHLGSALLCFALMWTNLFCAPLMEHSSRVPVADLIIRVRLDLGQNIVYILYQALKDRLCGSIEAACVVMPSVLWI